MKKYQGGNTNSIRDNYHEQKAYKEEITQRLRKGQFVDTFYTNPNYGLLNEKYQPVVPLVDEGNSNMNKFGDYSGQVMASFFTVTLFNKFRDHYLDFISKTDLTLPPYLAPSLKVDKGYENFDQRYLDYKNYMVNFFAEELKKWKFTDFYSFESYFIRLLIKNIEAFPLTRSGFLLSTHCPISVSGMSFELATLPYSVDDPKGQIFQSKSFYCFVDKCSDFGFQIDKNAPWRLFLNLKSSIVINELKKIQKNTSHYNILNHFYWTKTHYDDIFEIKEIATSVYNIIAREDPVVTKVINNPLTGHSEEVDILREEKIVDSTLSDEEYWIRLFWKIRAREVRIEPSEIHAMENKIVDFHNLRGQDWAPYWVNEVEVRRVFKSVSGKMGQICSEKLKEIYEMHESINNTEPTFVSSFARTNAREEDDQVEVVKLSKSPEAIVGSTSVNSLHDHQYEVDEDGNGWTTEAIHPENSNIKHKHKVISWAVQKASSECYPNCQERYGHPGVPGHIHFLDLGGLYVSGR